MANTVLETLQGIQSQLGQVREYQDAARLFRIQEQERLRSRKPIRFGLLSATGANPFSMGGDTNPQNVQIGPDEGFVWSIRLLIVQGLTTGATPDVVNIRLNSAAGRILWNLNGNSFGTTFGRGEMVLFGGDTLFVQSVGTFASTSTITLHGLTENISAERAGELY